MDIEKDKSTSNSNSVATATTVVVACSWDEVASDEDKARSRRCFGAVESWPRAGSRVAAARTKQQVSVVNFILYVGLETVLQIVCRLGVVSNL